ncbi:hypothetical protein CVT24_004196 [Panaeolus cyanescens]|uniref:Uncharacterized protein n=1 Tax=Panaeolus cyanescens TaxID=181874 RepID=A0A409W7V8_9AGAR|nr:hypothetical protein CVT24_004196 [Panaeolus cyanescens]
MASYDDDWTIINEDNSSIDEPWTVFSVEPADDTHQTAQLSSSEELVVSAKEEEEFSEYQLTNMNALIDFIEREDYTGLARCVAERHRRRQRQSLEIANARRTTSTVVAPESSN